MFGIKSSNSNFSLLTYYLWSSLLTIWFLISIWHIQSVSTEASSQQDASQSIPNYLLDLNIQQDRSELPTIFSLLSGAFLDYKTDIRRSIYCKVNNVDLVDEMLTIQEEMSVEIDMFSILFQYFAVTNNGLDEIIKILYNLFDLSNQYDFSLRMQYLLKVIRISQENGRFIADIDIELFKIVQNLRKLSNRINSLPLVEMETDSEDLMNCKKVLVMHQYNTYNTCLVFINFLEVLMGIETKKVVSEPLSNYNEIMISFGKVTRDYRNLVHKIFTYIFEMASDCKKVQLSISYPVLGSDISNIPFELPKSYVDYSNTNPKNIPTNLVIESINEATYMNIPFKLECIMIWNDLENKIDDTISDLRSLLTTIQGLEELFNQANIKVELYNLYTRLAEVMLSKYLDSNSDYDTLLQNSFNLLLKYQSKRMVTFLLDFSKKLYNFSKLHIEDINHILEHKNSHMRTIFRYNFGLSELDFEKKFDHKIKMLREVLVHLIRIYSNRAISNNMIKAIYSEHKYTSIAANLNTGILKDTILKHMSLFHELLTQKEQLLRIQMDYEDMLSENNHLSSNLDQINYLLSDRETLINNQCDQIKFIFKDVQNLVEDSFKVLDKIIYNVIFGFYREALKANESFMGFMSIVKLIFNTSDLNLDFLSISTGIVSFISRNSLEIQDLHFHAHINSYNKLRSCIGKFQEIDIDNLYFPKEFYSDIYMDDVNYLKNKDSILRPALLSLYIEFNDIGQSLNIRKMMDRVNFLSFYIGRVVEQVEAAIQLNEEANLTEDYLEMLYSLLFSSESLLVKETQFSNRISLFSSTLNDKIHTIASVFNILKFLLDSFFSDLFNIHEFKSITLQFEQLYDMITDIQNIEIRLMKKLVEFYKADRFSFIELKIFTDVLQISSTLYSKYFKDDYLPLLEYLDEMKNPMKFGGLSSKISNLLTKLENVGISGNKLKLDNSYKNRLIKNLSFKQHLNGRWFQKDGSYSKHILPSNCKIAYLDTIDVDKNTDDNTNVYDCVVIHCVINSLEDYQKFLSDRAQILEGILLPEEIYNLLKNDFLIHVMAIESNVEFSSTYINIIESKLILYFILLPLKDLVYFTNINSLVLYIDDIGQYLTNLIENSFSLFINGNLDMTKNGFLGTQIICIFKSDCKHPIKILGKYSGFNGEFPVAMAVMDHDKFNIGDIEDLGEVATATNIKANVNLKTVCTNFVKYKYLNWYVGYAWVLDKHSHLLHFMMFRKAFTDLFLSNSDVAPVLIYPVALSYIEERQFGMVSSFFNSLFFFNDYDYLKYIFYDPVLGYLYLDTRKKDLCNFAESLLEGITTSFKRILFENTVTRKVPYMELVISNNINQLVNLLITQTLPLYASARRNYEANLVLVTLNENFKLQDALKYRILLRSISAETKLIIRNLPSKSALRKIYGIKTADLDIEECKFSYSNQIAGILDEDFHRLITAIDQLPNKVSRANNCPALNEFLSELSIEAIKTQEMIPITAVSSVLLTQTDKVLIDNQVYEVLPYNEDNVFEISLLYLNEQKSGKKYIFMAHQSYILQDFYKLKLSDFVHIYDCVRNIVMVGSETLIRIFYNKVQRDNVLLIIPLLMEFYTGYGISLIEDNNEYFIDYDSCINGDCRHFKVFRYLTCNIYETLVLYQKYLNEADDELVLIVPYGERPNIYFAGFNVVTRFGGAFMFRSANGLEVHYSPQQFDSACNFVLQFYNKNPELEVKMVCYDLNIDDLTIPIGATTCPVGPLTGTEIQPCYASGRRINIDGKDIILLVTIYEGFELEAIHEILSMRLNRLPVRYTFEGQAEVQEFLVEGTWTDIRELLNIHDNLNLITIKTTSDPKSHVLASKIKELLIKLFGSSYMVNIIDRFDVKIN
ncbi:hypothetical protein ACR3K2_31460 [Cryptosporidium serpentis]